MIRQRFGSGRVARIGAWALAAVTAVAAVLSNQIAAAENESTPPGEAAVDRFVRSNPAVPAAPTDGLLILRYHPTPPPPPPTIVRRVIVEERVAGATGSAPASAGSRATTAPATAPAAAASPAPPPPAPAPLPAPAPVQSSGS